MKSQRLCWGYGLYADAALKLMGRQCPCGKTPGHATRELTAKVNPKPDTIENYWENP